MKSSMILVAVVVGFFAATFASAGLIQSTVKPKTNPKQWITMEGGDWDVVIRQGGGTATVAFDISVEGRVENCRVTKPAPENALIGKKICDLLAKRGKFAPGAAGSGTWIDGPVDY